MDGRFLQLVPRGKVSGPRGTDSCRFNFTRTDHWLPPPPPRCTSSRRPVFPPQCWGRACVMPNSGLSSLPERLSASRAHILFGWLVLLQLSLERSLRVLVTTPLLAVWLVEQKFHVSAEFDILMRSPAGRFYFLPRVVLFVHVLAPRHPVFLLELLFFYVLH